MKRTPTTHLPARLVLLGLILAVAASLFPAVAQATVSVSRAELS